MASSPDVTPNVHPFAIRVSVMVDVLPFFRPPGWIIFRGFDLSGQLPGLVRKYSHRRLIAYGAVRTNLVIVLRHSSNFERASSRLMNQCVRSEERRVGKE